jgi:hypothetical protein
VNAQLRIQSDAVLHASVPREDLDVRVQPRVDVIVRHAMQRDICFVRVSNGYTCLR